MNDHTLYEEIQVTLKLKKSIAFVGRLISYQEKKSFDEFVSEEIRQAILAIGPDLYLTLFQYPDNNLLR